MYFKKFRLNLWPNMLPYHVMKWSEWHEGKILHFSGIFGYLYFSQYVVNFNVIFAPWVLREKNYMHVGDLCPSRDKKLFKGLYKAWKVVCIKLILVRFSTTWHYQKVTIPITQMWWNVMPSTNEKSHVINFWIFAKIFKQNFLKWEFWIVWKTSFSFCSISLCTYFLSLCWLGYHLFLRGMGICWVM